MDTSEILDLNKRVLDQGARIDKKRFVFQQLAGYKGKPFIALIGPRGAGKTTLLKQVLASRSDALYISLDSIEIDDLFEVVKTFSESYHYTTFLLDEIHHIKHYDQAIKKIYDFLDVSLVFTSSVALSLYESVYDLSRRVSIVHLYSFSFREFIFFKTGTLLPELTIRDIIAKTWTPEHLRFGYLFEQFMKGGLLPFSLENPDIITSLGHILDTIVSRDIPLMERLRIDEPETIKKLVRFVGNAPVDGISYSSLSHNLKITKYKAEQYVGLLEQAFVLQRVMPKGTNVLKEPKVLMYLPYRLLYKPYDEALGGLREDFFMEMTACRGLEVFYLKSTRGAKTPDYYVREGQQDYIIEIGGRGKGRQQFKGITASKSLILAHGEDTQGLKRPLFLIGY